MKVLFVCLGNICRSPIAHGILDDLIITHNLNWTVDSAGTSNYHAGEPPHKDSQKVCQTHGIDISHQKSRPICLRDFEEFDIIYTMDNSVHNHVINMAPSTAHQRKVQLINDLDPLSEFKEVPDPYYGGPQDFYIVFNLLSHLCNNIINKYAFAHSK